VKAGSSSARQRALDELSLPAASRTRIESYLEVLERWASRTNLTSVQSSEERVRVLVAAVMAAVPYVRTGRLLDVGSGNGSPGLVLALLRPDLEVTLLEPRLKRWAFLRDAARACGAVVAVERMRHEDYQGPRADTLTVRALRLTASDAARLQAPQGRWIVFGRAPAPDPRYALTRSLAGAQLHLLDRCPEGPAGVSRET
jgi:16S rRNA (guanine527-N7)-methyltransferase